MSYLVFEDKGTSESGKTKRWLVKNKLDKSLLGWVDWKAAWRRYVFSTSGASFDAGCLHEIGAFLESEMAKR